MNNPGIPLANNSFILRSYIHRAIILKFITKLKINILRDNCLCNSLYSIKIN